jgi:hypothetical protein
MVQLRLNHREKPEIHNIVNIYDPDIHTTNSLAVGKIVPEIGAFVFDQNGYYRRVKSIDERYKVTYATAFFETVESEYLIDYGNDIFFLYYNKEVIPTKLIVDNKIPIFGLNSYYYKLKKYINENWVDVGYHIDPSDQSITYKIPLVESNVDNIYTCSPCYTNYDIQDNDVFKIEIYNNSDEYVMRIMVVSTSSTVINQLPVVENPIVDFIIRSSQDVGEEIILYENQDPYEIGIYPTLIYADGAELAVDVNNLDCFVYGIDELIPPYFQTRFKIIAKYFPPDTSELNTNLLDLNSNHITAEKWVVVSPIEISTVGKVSIIPQWDHNTSKWSLILRAYMKDRTKAIRDVTNKINWIKNINLTLINSIQPFEFNITDNALVFTNQTGFINLTTFSNNTPFVIDSYGGIGQNTPRPRLIYNQTTQLYNIPETEFHNSTIFLDSFYYNANPPYNPDNGESTAIEPTHFNILDAVTGQAILSIPKAIIDYNTDIFITENIPGEYKNKIVIMEFLEKINDVYYPIYGVPVEIK